MQKIQINEITKRPIFMHLRVDNTNLTVHTSDSYGPVQNLPSTEWNFYSQSEGCG